jgi:hypothetical protein
VFCWTSASAQYETEEVETEASVPDTFQFFKPENVAALRSLDSLGTVVDTLDETVFIVATDKQWFGDSYVVALKTKKGFAAFVPTTGSHHDTVEFETHNFNGVGKNELVVRWTDYGGHTGWENSLHERNKHIRIWDLDSLKCLFDFQYYTSYQNWWTIFEPDSTNALPYEQRTEVESGGELLCKTYDVKLGLKTVSIVQTDDCPDQGEDNEPIGQRPEPVVYELKKTWLTRRL